MQIVQKEMDAVRRDIFLGYFRSSHSTPWLWEKSLNTWVTSSVHYLKHYDAASSWFWGWGTLTYVQTSSVCQPNEGRKAWHVTGPHRKWQASALYFCLVAVWKIQWAGQVWAGLEEEQEEILITCLQVEAWPIFRVARKECGDSEWPLKFLNLCVWLLVWAELLISFCPV